MNHKKPVTVHPAEGPRGWTIFQGRPFALDKWQIVSAIYPKGIKGWFSCIDIDFAPSRNAQMHLALYTIRGELHQFDIEITVAITDARRWEFKISD